MYIPFSEDDRQKLCEYFKYGNNLNMNTMHIYGLQLIAAANSSVGGE